jgi:hypothetical protein
MHNNINIIGTPPFYGSYLAATSNGKYGYVDQYHNIQIPFVFDWAFPFEGEVAKVFLGNKYGFINKSGNYICRPKYDFVEPFVRGTAKVQLNNSFGYINLQGLEIVPPIFVDGKDFLNGVAVVGIDGQQKYMKTEDIINIVTATTGGSSLAPTGFHYIKTLYGSIDMMGNFIMTPQYISLSDIFDDRHIALTHHNQYLIVDRYGSKVSNKDYLDLQLVKNSCVLAKKVVRNWLGQKKELYGLINMDETEITDFEYDSYSYGNKEFELFKNGTRAFTWPYGSL